MLSDAQLVLQVFAEAVVSPAIPSTGGRNGGLIIPLAKALLGACGADRENSEQMDSGSDRRMGAYLMLSCFHGSCISSAMFSTASASNALAIKLAADVGVEITWGTWALSALAPGLLCLVLMPLIIYALFPPEIKVRPAL